MNIYPSLLDFLSGQFTVSKRIRYKTGKKVMSAGLSGKLAVRASRACSADDDNVAGEHPSTGTTLLTQLLCHSN